LFKVLPISLGRFYCVFYFLSASEKSAPPPLCLFPPPLFLENAQVPLLPVSKRPRHHTSSSRGARPRSQPASFLCPYFAVSLSPHHPKLRPTCCLNSPPVFVFLARSCAETIQMGTRTVEFCYHSSPDRLPLFPLIGTAEKSATTILPRSFSPAPFFFLFLDHVWRGGENFAIFPGSLCFNFSV